MDDGVLLALTLSEVFQDREQVCVLEQFDHVVHRPSDSLRHVNPGNFGKELAEKWIGLRNAIRCGLPGELFLWRGVDARGEQAVGQRLREHIGELLFVEVGD